MDVNWNKYSLSNLRQLIYNPRIARGVVRHAAETANRKHYQNRRNFGCRVMEEDWDSLLILDGCRADAFSDQCPFEGCHSRRLSRGSGTPEWLRENFLGSTHHDTVYLTANPYVRRVVPDGTFHDVIDVLDEDWDDDLGVVPPKPMCDRLVEMRERYPNKRLIAHYLQPHYPFIGEFGRSVDDSSISVGKGEGNNGGAHGNPWRDLKFGLSDTDQDTIWRAYCENLDVVLDALSDLLPQLSGRTVISADHGNLAGEQMSPVPARGFGHPIGLHVPELVEVPWFVIEDSDRPDIVAEEPVSGRTANYDIEERLGALGYV